VVCDSDFTFSRWNILKTLVLALRAHEKHRKCLFVSILNFAKSASEIIFDHYTNRYSMFTRRNFQKCKIYLLPDGISNWAPIYTYHVTVVCRFLKTSFLIRRLSNSRTRNNRRFFTISDLKIYLRGYICKMAQILIKYSEYCITVFSRTFVWD
jgi:hypothetical protein